MPPRVDSKRQQFTVLGIGLCFAGALGSQIGKQTLERGHTIDLANKTKRYELTQHDYASRGAILTADGKYLARDEESYDLTVNFNKCPKTDAFWMDLAEATGIPATEFKEMAASGAETRIWPQSVSNTQKPDIDRVRRFWRADGVSANRTGRREYAFGDVASCLVGVIRKDYNVVQKGDRGYQALYEKLGPPPASKPYYVTDLLTGMEASLDDHLKGTDGVKIGVADRNGYFLPMRVNEEKSKRTDGEKVVLTIDSEMQSVASLAIRKAVEKEKAESGVAIVLDPSTGDILAMANWPSFKPYDEDGSYATLGKHGGLNQAYMSALEPGSMFKVLTLAKALNDGVVHWGDHLACAGEWKAFKRAKPIRCDLHASGRAHGDITVSQAISRSCNISAAHWALAVKRDPFIQYMKDLGLLRKPQLGLKGAQAALFQQKSPAPQLQLAIVGFGQSINVTPVALAGAFGTIANGGVRMEPRLIKQIGRKVIAPEPGKQVLTAQSCNYVLEAMEQTFEDSHGTARSLRIPGYRLGGKTGTAQKLAKTQDGNVSNFIGFVPADKPKVEILVMVNKPGAGEVHGGVVAGPVFKEIAQAAIRRFQIPATAPTVATRVPSVDQSKSLAGSGPQIQVRKKRDVKRAN